MKYNVKPVLLNDRKRSFVSTWFQKSIIFLCIFYAFIAMSSSFMTTVNAAPIDPNGNKYPPAGSGGSSGGSTIPSYTPEEVVVPNVPPPSNTPSQSGSSSQAEDTKGILNTVKQIYNNIINLPQNVGNALISIFVEPIRRYFNVNAARSIAAANGSLVVFRNMLTSEDLHSTTYTFSKQLWTALKPFAYSLVSLFFVISLCKKTMYFEMMTDIEVYKMLIKLVFTKELVDHSYDLMAVIVNMNKEMINAVFNLVTAVNNSEFLRWIDTSFNADFATATLNYMKASAFVLVILFLLVICKVMVIIRQIEVAVLSSVSSLFFATFAGDSSSDVFKSFLKNFVSVVAQTLWISIGLAFLMNSYLKSTNVDSSGFLMTGNFIIGMVALTVYCVQAPSSVRNAIGGSGGGGFSLSSLAHALK